MKMSTGIEACWFPFYGFARFTA